MAITLSFRDLLAQQRRKRRLTGVPGDIYGVAEAQAAGASGRLAQARTTRLSEEAVATQAEQYGVSKTLVEEQFATRMGMERSQFAKSLAEQKRAAGAFETESVATRQAQEEAARKARTQAWVGTGTQAGLTGLLAYNILGKSPGTYTPATYTPASEVGGAGAEGFVPPSDALPAHGGQGLVGARFGPAAGYGAAGVGGIYMGGMAARSPAARKVAQFPAGQRLSERQSALVAGGGAGALTGLAMGGPIGAGVGAAGGAYAGYLEAGGEGGLGFGEEVGTIPGNILGVPELNVPVTIAADVAGKVIPKEVDTFLDPVVKVISGGTVICAELNKQGYISDYIRKKDAEYSSKEVTPEEYAGYRLWADSIVSLMQHSKLFTWIVSLIGIPTTQEMASRIDSDIRGTKTGKFILKVFKPICGLIGKGLFRGLNLGESRVL